jgi:hypothetical protein
MTAMLAWRAAWRNSPLALAVCGRDRARILVVDRRAQIIARQASAT